MFGDTCSYKLLSFHSKTRLTSVKQFYRIQRNNYGRMDKGRIK